MSIRFYKLLKNNSQLAMANQNGPSRARQPLGFAPNDGQPDRACNQAGLWKCGGGCRDRTDDPLLAKQVLSQLS
jgi:hypothetical protein